MGSSTVRGFSGRLRFFQFLSLALFALIFAGCELEEGDSTSPGSSPPLSTHTFGNKVKVRFMVPTVDGPVEVTNNESLQRALKRAVPPPENVRAQGTPAEYVGNILTSDNGFGIYPADTSGEIEVYNSLAKAVVGAFIIDTQAINTGYDTGTITYRYYPPSPDQGLSLSTFITNDITSEYSVSDSSVVRAGDPVEAQVNYAYVTDYPGGVLNRVYSGTISLNGEVVFTFENVRSTGDSEFLPVTPCFASKESGDARLELIGNRGDERQSDFIQKGLEFRQETQDFEIQPNQTASIRNDFGWDLGANPDSLVQPSWEVEIVDPQKQVIKTFSGSGRQISANWTPDGLSSPIRLVPMDRFLQDGEVPVYGYRLKAKAKIGDPVFGTGSIFYELTNDRENGELNIVNIKLDPDPPFQNEETSVDLTAEVLAVGLGDLTDDDIEWWVDLLDPSGEVVGAPLATGNGFEVSATWDGQVEGSAVEDPSSYTLRIRAKMVCDSGARPRQAQIRAQSTEACTGPLAQAEVGLMGPRFVVRGMVVRESGQTGGPIAAEEKVGLGFSPEVLESGGSSTSQQLRTKLLGEVFALQVSEDSYKVDLEVEVAFPEDVTSETAPSKLLLQARNMLTGQVLDIEAHRAKNESSFVYRTDSENPAKLTRGFVDADPGGNEAATRYSVGEFYRDKSVNFMPVKPGAPGSSKGSSEAFMHLVETSPVFPSPKAFLGRFAETAIASDVLRDIYPTGAAGPSESPVFSAGSFPQLSFLKDSPLDQPLKNAIRLITTVTSNPDNLIATGFVSIEFVVKEDQGNPAPQPAPEPLTPVYVKVPRFPSTQTQLSRSPNVVLWTYHGDDHENGTIHPSSDYDRSVPVASRKGWDLAPSRSGLEVKLASVKTLIITGCSVLDINDYNNGFAVIHDNDPNVPGDETWDLVNERNHGGEKWDAAMRVTEKDGAVILGFNDVSPLLGNGGENRVAELMELFEAELTRLSSVPLSERRQWAWMSANVKLATAARLDKSDSRWTALHAVAIDRDFYYYIPQLKNRQTPVQSSTGTGFVTYDTVLRTVVAVAPVWRVARTPSQPPRPLPPNSPPPPANARREWGVFYPGQVDLYHWKFNRDNFALPVAIPGLTYPYGGPR